MTATRPNYRNLTINHNNFIISTDNQININNYIV